MREDVAMAVCEAAARSNCHKRVVVAVLYDANDQIISTGCNMCSPPNSMCSRLQTVQTKATYDEKAAGCGSTHAEIQALEGALERAAVFEENIPVRAEVYGHDFACDSCEKALNHAGITNIKIIPNGYGTGLRDRSKLPTVYLAGPIAGCTEEEANGWRNQMMQKLGHKFNFKNPMVRDHRGDYVREIHEALIVEGDKADIDSSEIIVVNIWKIGVGTAQEEIYAWNKGKTVLLIAPNDWISPWHSYHADHIFKSVDKCIDWMSKLK